MVTLEKLNPFWDREYTVLDYSNEPFNDSHAVDWWLNAGYHDKFTGDMCDMRKPQPSWKHKEDCALNVFLLSVVDSILCSLFFFSVSFFVLSF